MKKHILLRLSFLLLCVALTATAACAKPVIDVFSNKSRDLGQIRTILVMPAIIDANVPEQEHFFNETVSQTWSEVATQERFGSRFIVKTTEQIMDFERLFGNPYVSETAEPDPAIAALYVDAVMTLTVTEAYHGMISHEQQVKWRPRSVGIGGGYWHGGWHPHGGISIQRDTVPAYDEIYATGVVKIEIRDARDGENTLLYGISARETEKSGMLPNTPSLTKLTDGLVREAAAEVKKLKP